MCKTDYIKAISCIHKISWKAYKRKTRKAYGLQCFYKLSQTVSQVLVSVDKLISAYENKLKTTYGNL